MGYLRNDNEFSAAADASGWRVRERDGASEIKFDAEVKILHDVRGNIDIESWSETMLIRMYLVLGMIEDVSRYRWDVAAAQRAIEDELRGRGLL
jgi:hypothetical protein